MSSIAELQRGVCSRVRSPCVPCEENLKVGLARNVSSGLLPVNGLRHPPAGDTTGWYIWAGEEMGTGDDFFEPVHVRHLAEICPVVLPYLGLAPGWRFLVAPGHEDVWSDPTLLDVPDEP